MRKLRIAVLSGVAALAVAGAALATSRDMHVMRVGLPDGSVARIEYVGNVAPRVTVAPAFNATPMSFLDVFDRAPFAALDRMDDDMEAMVHEIGAFQPALPAGHGKVDLVALSKLPPGTVSYRFISTSNGNDTCSRSVEVTSYGPDQKPKVVSSSFGDCTSTNQAPTPARLDDPTGPAVPGLAKTAVTAPAERPRATDTI